MGTSVLKRISGLALLSLGGFILTPSALAQRASTGLSGTVSDTSGAVVQKASVTLTSQETGFHRTTTSNDAGIYSFPDLTPGVYDASAEAQGFKTALVKGLVLYVGVPLVQNFALEVGAVSEQVSVVATAPLLRQNNAEIGSVIEGKVLTELPLNGRNYLQLNLLTPGVTRSKNSNTFDDVQLDSTAKSFNVNGQRADYNVYLLDGVNVKEYQHGTNMFSPSVDAIQEFNQASSNYSAAFGAEAGAQVSVVTKAGTNRVHGSAYDFLRNNQLDARNFFEQNKSAPPYRRNQFGGSLGGPVYVPGVYNGRDRTFFFVSYEGLRESKDSPLYANYPTLDQLRGDLSTVVAGDQPLLDPTNLQPFPGNVIPRDRIPSTLIPFFENGIGKGTWLPAPNTNTLGSNYFMDGARRADKDQVVVRIDQALGTRTFLYGRYGYNKIRLVNPNTNPNWYGAQQNDAHSVAAHLSHTLTPNLVFEFTLGYSRFLQDEPMSTAGKYDITNKILQIQGLATNSSSWGAPGWGVTGYSELGEGGSLPRLWTPRSREFRPAWSWIRGKHSFRFGGEINRHTSTFKEIIGPNGSFSFDGRFTNYALADFLLGMPSSSFFSPEPFDPQHRYSELAGYFQDDWKVTPHFVLNLGMRYEWLGAPYSASRTYSNIYLGPDNAAPIIVTSKNVKGITFEGVQHELLTILPYVSAESVGLPDSLLVSDKRNWSPRLGFAYSLPASTVLRGGYGLFYQRDTENKFIDMALNPPFVGMRNYSFDRSNIGQFDWFRPGELYDVSGVGLFANDPYMKSGRVQAWNLSLEHMLAGTLLSAAYVGNTAQHLSNLEVPNQARPGAGPIASRRRWPDTGVLYWQNYNGMANYNGLQLKAQRNFANGLMFMAGYTWSKTIDDSGGTFVGEGGRGFVFQDGENRHSDRGLAAQDIRHRFVLSYVYELPFGRGRRFLNHGGVTDLALGGWQMNGVTSFQTGSPLTITQQCNRANTDSGNMRPDVVGNWKLPSGRSSGELVSRFFNTGAFYNYCPADQGPFNFGNAGRNIVIGPGMNNWDFGLYKEFRLPGEDTRLQFRSEFFNLFNHPIFGQPGSTAGTPQFGTITYLAVDPREIQFALRLSF